MSDQQTETGEDTMGETAQVNRDFAKEVATDANLYMSRSVALTARAGSAMWVSRSGASALAAGKDMYITNSGGNAFVAGGNIEITGGGGGVLVAGKSGTVNHGFVGMIISQQTILGEGSRVLLDTPQAIAFGAALGAAFGVVCWLLGRRQAKKK